MAEKNILKNEFVQEEQNKKKSWKPYAAVLGILLIGAGTGLGVYYGLHTHHSSVTKKINLNILKPSIDGTTAMIDDDSGQEALKSFITNNADYSDLENNVEITSWDTPTYKLAGKLTLEAKTNSKKYTGTITVTISAIGQTLLTDLNLNLDPIQGTEDMNDEDAWKAFLVNNETMPSDLKDNAEYSITKEPGYKSEDNGTFTIVSTIDKYTGMLNVPIDAIGQTSLGTIKDLNLQVASDTSEETALENFLTANINYPDLDGNVTLKEDSFEAPGYDEFGSYIIVANETGKYTGEVKVIISTILPENANQAVDIINQFIHQDLPIDGTGQTILFTEEEWTTISNSSDQQRALYDVLSDKAFLLLKQFNPNFANNIAKFTITGKPSDWNNNVDGYHYPDYSDVAAKLNSGLIWEPDTTQFNGKAVPLLTVGFQVTLKDGSTSDMPLVGGKNDASDGKGHYSGNKDGEYKNSFGVIWNLNIKMGIQN